MQFDQTVTGATVGNRQHEARNHACPCGLAIERIETEAEKLLIVGRPASMTDTCPTRGTVSARVHGKYRRILSDLRSQGRAVRVSVQAQRFRCVVAGCRQRIFSERLKV